MAGLCGCHLRVAPVRCTLQIIKTWLSRTETFLDTAVNILPSLTKKECSSPLSPGLLPLLLLYKSSNFIQNTGVNCTTLSWLAWMPLLQPDCAWCFRRHSYDYCP